MIGPNDLVQADNVVFSSNGSRLKREGFEYLDTAIPASATRSSSGTTRTLVFASSVSIASPEDRIIVVGERINVTGSGNANYNCTNGEVLSVSTTTITYTFSGASSLTESSTADTGMVVTRNSSVVGVHDYWYYDRTNNVKARYRMALTSQGKLFRYDANGRRKEITKRAEVAQVQTVQTVAASSLTGGDYFNLYSAKDVTRYLVWYEKGGVGTAPVVTGATAVKVTINNADTADQVASATNTAIDALADFSSTVSTNTVTITNAAVGDCTTVADSPTATATTFTFARTTAGTGPATAITGTITQADMRTYNNRLIFTLSGVGNTPKIYYADDGTDTWEDLYGAPDGSIIGEHQNRLLLNSKTDRDRLYYSPPFDHTLWQGRGDSGAVRISDGDGDAEGISAIFPSFRNRVIGAKRSSVHQIAGDDLTTDPVLTITKGHGALSHKAVAAVDLDDVLYVSQRGIHSIVATDAQGEFTSEILSDKIQVDFNELEQTRLRFTQAAYLPSVNSVAFSVAEEDATSQTDLLLLNIKNREWYKWPNVNAQAISTFLDPSTNKIRLMMGLQNGRIALSDRGTFTDYENSPISFRVKSGAIYVDGNPQTVKGFKKLTLFFKPRGDFSFTAYVKVDNLPVQALSFTQTAASDLLGSTFILGTSLLGADSVLQPFTKEIYGYGRGLSLEIFQSSQEGQVEIYGYAIEYEPADVANETT